MWHRKELKKRARSAIKHNYLRCLTASLLLAMFAGGTNGLSLSLGAAEQLASVNFRTASNTEIVNILLLSSLGENTAIWHQLGQLSSATRGIMAGLFNNITSSGDVLFGILNAINQFVFNDAVLAGIVVLVGVLVSLLYWAFVGNTLHVGVCRFFLENTAYPASKLDNLLFLLRVKRIKNPVKIMFFRALYNGLWWLTIVGGVVKMYAYRMIPYLLAENPEITQKEAFILSARMMRGEKWRVFLLDVSFWFWNALSLLTAGIVGIVIVYPYKAAADAHLYLRLRQKVLAREPGAASHLIDTQLFPTPQEGACEYPAALYPIPENPAFSWLSVECRPRYSLRNSVLMFFTFCMGGYVWEVFIDLANTGHFVNRGMLYGPWLPLYGCGGMLIIVLLYHFSNRPLATFGLTVVLCGVLESTTSWALEMMFGAKWWDYSGYFLNLHGRICAEGLLVFGIGGCIAVYFVAPSLNNLFDKIPKKIRTVLCAGLILLFCIDLGFSITHPNMAATSQNPHSSTAATENAAAPPAQSAPKGALWQAGKW